MISNGLEAFHVNSDVLASIEETCLSGFVHASSLQMCFIYSFHSICYELIF